MTFAEKLNEYMNTFFCSPKKLVRLSGVSAATISRYRAGTREPAANSEILENIAKGLSLAAAEAEKTDVSADQIGRELRAALHNDPAAYDVSVFRVNLETLMTRLHLNARRISSFLGMDQSRFFRIRSGQTRPQDIDAFCFGIGRYIYGALGDDAPDILSDILGCTPSELISEESVCRRIADFLMGVAYSPRSYAESFLRELDGFVGGDEPPAPDKSSYTFLSEEEKAFLSTLENASKDSSVIICTDLYSGGIDEDRMMKNLEYIIAVLVRRNVRVDLVLNADNPMDEILPGLISLMPVFMSGNVSVYYLRGRRDGIYRYRLVSLETAALCCEAVTGHYDTVVTHVAFSEDEVRLYRQRAHQILHLASPLIHIIDSCQKRMSLLAKGSHQQGKRLSVLSTPPFFTMNEALLKRILDRNEIPVEQADSIMQYFFDERARVEEVLKHSEYVCSYPDIPREYYDEKPVFLSLSGLFYNREILCAYDEYAEHIRLMKDFEKEHKSFCCIADKNSPFRNIQIFMQMGSRVMLSKNRTPTVHLVIEHSKLRQALENILSPYSGKI